MYNREPSTNTNFIIAKKIIKPEDYEYPSQIYENIQAYFAKSLLYIREAGRAEGGRGAQEFHAEQTVC